MENEKYEYVSIEDFAHKIVDALSKEDVYKTSFIFLPKGETKYYKDLVFNVEKSSWRIFYIETTMAGGTRFLVIGDGVARNTIMIHDPTLGNEFNTQYLINNLYDLARKTDQSTDGIVMEKPKNERSGNTKIIYISYSTMDSIDRYYEVTEEEYEGILNGDIPISEFVDTDLFDYGLGKSEEDAEVYDEDGKLVFSNGEVYDKYED